MEAMLSKVPSERQFQMYIWYKKVKDGLSNAAIWTGTKVRESSPALRTSPLR